MNIELLNRTGESGFDDYREDYEKIAQRAEDVLQLERDYDMSVIFVDADEIHEINRDYRQVDRPTDVISFAMQDSDDGFVLEEVQNELGDIFISIDAVKQQAEEYGHSQRREACFLFTHGLLHLLGYDHMEPEDEKEMFALQDEILDALVPKSV